MGLAPKTIVLASTDERRQMGRSAVLGTVRGFQYALGLPERSGMEGRGVSLTRPRSRPSGGLSHIRVKVIMDGAFEPA
jgi:hypothetical protein